MNDRLADCLIIGGGPAGLTAAIYLARFHLKAVVVDAGDSRAAWIPKTRNHAGYPEGIAGPDLLERMRAQALLYGTELIAGRVDQLVRADGGFSAQAGPRTIEAPTVLLATGVVNNRPPRMDDAVHDAALARGCLRYCPICDAFEVTDQRVGVIGTGERGTNEAVFLRSYTRDVTLIAPEGEHELHDSQRRTLAEAGIAIADGPVGDFSLREEAIEVGTPQGPLSFASIYPALGSRIRSELAVGIGAEASDDGCMTVDNHQRTSIPGLYAAGDVVLGLDQISHAMGEGGVAATTIRNELAAERRLYR